MKSLTKIILLAILLMPLVTTLHLAGAVVGGPYTNKVSVQLGSSDKSSGNGFNPQEIIVSVGTTVTWRNDDTVGHTIISGTMGDPNSGQLFSTGSRWGPEAKFEHIFDKVGEFPYFCQIYPWMTGKVIVAEVVIQGEQPEPTPEPTPTTPEQEEQGMTIRDFLVQDKDGDQMFIRVSPSKQEAFNALTDMSKTGETKWVGGEIQSFKNKFGFRFMPSTIVVAETTAEGLQASKYKTVQENITYWKGLGTVYISGEVVSIRDKITVKYQDRSFNVTTTFSSGVVKSIDLDRDSTSIILKLDASATRDGNLTVTLPRELIDSKVGGAADKKFTVTVGNDKVGYKELKPTDTERKLRIHIPAGATQVEITGTQVVPEFPLGLAIILTSMVSLMVVMTRIRKISGKISY